MSIPWAVLSIFSMSPWEIIIKKENKITKYKAADNTEGTGKGRRVGIAYELENGEIIYIPENNNQ